MTYTIREDALDGLSQENDPSMDLERILKKEYVSPEGSSNQGKRKETPTTREDTNDRNLTTLTYYIIKIKPLKV